MPLPPDYLAALEALAHAFADYRSRTGNDAILVGGAAAAIHTAGLFPSGDFDVVAANDAAFEEAMLAQGFEKESRARYLQMGFFHPRHPAYGFQQVSGSLFDGQSDLKRLIFLTIGRGEGVSVAIPSIEDMIADRLGQHAVFGPSDDSRLRQALALFQLKSDFDVQYLRHRIETEGGDPALLGL